MPTLTDAQQSGACSTPRAGPRPSRTFARTQPEGRRSPGARPARSTPADRQRFGSERRERCRESAVHQNHEEPGSVLLTMWQCRHPSYPPRPDQRGRHLPPLRRQALPRHPLPGLRWFSHRRVLRRSRHAPRAAAGDREVLGLRSPQPTARPRPGVGRRRACPPRPGPRSPGRLNRPAGITRPVPPARFRGCYRRSGRRRINRRTWWRPSAMRTSTSRPSPPSMSGRTVAPSRAVSR